MNPKGTRSFGAPLALPVHKQADEIIKRTGETKVELLTRLLASDHKRIMEKSSLPETMNSNLESVLKGIGELSSAVKELSADVPKRRDLDTKAYFVLLGLIKEQFRMMMFLTGIFSQSSMLQKQQLSSIQDDTDSKTTDYFNSFVEMMNTSDIKDIFKFIKNR